MRYIVDKKATNIKSLRDLVFKSLNLKENNRKVWAISDISEDGKLLLLNFKENALFHKYNGCIFDIGSKKLLFEDKNFYSSKFTSFDHKTYNITLNDEKLNITNFTVYKFLEGLTIRILLYNSTVYFFTKRKLNLDKSYTWNTQTTFYDLYLDAGGIAKEMFFNVNKEYSNCYYEFVLTDDRFISTNILSEDNKPILTFIGKFPLNLPNNLTNVSDGILEIKNFPMKNILQSYDNKSICCDYKLKFLC